MGAWVRKGAGVRKTAVRGRTISAAPRALVRPCPRLSAEVVPLQVGGAFEGSGRCLN